jgi:uncharacterized protein YndB with AHSA1/START domain
MGISSAAMGIESLSVVITREMHIKASLETTFEALLEQLGPENESPERKMPMKIEAWPGGRWYRDLGDGNGHLWGHVQAIKRPTLLEFCGPLFMSYAVANNVQYRLSAEKGGTLLVFQHKAFGFIPEEHRVGMGKGWAYMLERIQAKAEGKK